MVSQWEEWTPLIYLIEYTRPRAAVSSDFWNLRAFVLFKIALTLHDLGPYPGSPWDPFREVGAGSDQPGFSNRLEHSSSPPISQAKQDF